MPSKRRSDTGGQRQTSGAQRWHALLDQSLSAIYGFIFSQVGNREDAEQLTAQVFTEAARRLPDPADLHAACQLLCCLARETVSGHMRKFYALAMEGASADQMVEWDTLLAANDDHGRAASERVEQVLMRLPAPARDLLVHRLLAGQSLQATASALHLSVTQARQMQYDALRQASETVLIAGSSPAVNGGNLQGVATRRVDRMQREPSAGEQPSHCVCNRGK